MSRVPPSFNDPKGILDKLIAGEVPNEALHWLIVGHDDLVAEVEGALDRIEHGKSAMSMRFLEGPPGSGKTSLLRLLGSIALDHGFAVSALDLDSKAGQFTDKKWLVPAILRALRAPSSGAEIDLDGILKKFSTMILEDFPEDPEEGLNARRERLRAFLADRLAKYNIEEKVVEDVVLAYLFAFEVKDHTRMRRVVEWFTGVGLSQSEMQSQAGAWTKIDERNAFPVLRSTMSLLADTGCPGIVLLFDELVQAMEAYRASQRQRIHELIRLLHSGVLPNTLTFVAATPESLEDEERGVSAHPGMKSRLGDGKIDARDPGETRYRISPLNMQESETLMGRLEVVFRVAHHLDGRWLEGKEPQIVRKCCPPTGALPRDFVVHAIRAMKAQRRSFRSSASS